MPTGHDPRRSAHRPTRSPLSAFDAGPFPVVSLYLNLRPDGRGRDQFRAVSPERARGSDAHVSGQQTGAREPEQGRSEDQRVCHHRGSGVKQARVFRVLYGVGLFEANPLAAALGHHPLYIPISRTCTRWRDSRDLQPRYLALVADTKSARIFVFRGNRRRTYRSHRRHQDQTPLRSAACPRRGISDIRRTTTCTTRRKSSTSSCARSERRGGSSGSSLPATKSYRAVCSANRSRKEIAERDCRYRAPRYQRALERDILRHDPSPLVREQDAASDRERVEALDWRVSRRADSPASGIEQTRRGALEMGSGRRARHHCVRRKRLPGSRPPRMRQAGEIGPGAAPPTSWSLARNTGASIWFIEDASILQAYRWGGRVPAIQDLNWGTLNYLMN